MIKLTIPYSEIFKIKKEILYLAEHCLSTWSRLHIPMMKHCESIGLG